MRLEHVIYLCSTFPTIKRYIIECFNRGEYDQLLDFLFSLETHDPAKGLPLEN